MKKLGVGILGLGVVGSGTYKILTDKREYFKKTKDIDVTVEGVLEINKDKARALGIEENCIYSNIAEIVANPNIDIVVEVIGGVEPAKTFVLSALMGGKTVVTSNKELFSKHWAELEEVARHHGAGLLFEASCVGGVPIIRTLIDGVEGNRIKSLIGIVNGTTNYILTKMTDDNAGYEETLKEAQRLGYAEANPSADVDGFDSMYKLSILSSLAFNKKVPLDKIYREGITKITKEDIAYGKELGYVLKLLAIGKDGDKGVEVRVHPTFIKKDNPLAMVKDSFNAVMLTGDDVGDIMLYGRGAGDMPTGSAIVSDILYAGLHSENFYTVFNNNPSLEAKVTPDFESKYYIRFSANNESGVLAKISGILSKYDVNITDVIQKSDEVNGRVPLIFITHTTSEQALQKAIVKINALEDLVTIENIIRVGF